MGLEAMRTNLWHEWDFWTKLQTRLVHIDDANNWYTRAIKKTGDEDEVQVRERRETSWQALFPERSTPLNLFSTRSGDLLATGIRNLIRPTRAQLQDTEQPWDLDHIHPQNYVQGVNNIPPIIKAVAFNYWKCSCVAIGNKQGTT